MTIDNGQTTTVPRLVGTANITAGFTSPVLTTAVNTITYTNTFANVIQTTNTSALTTEYYGAQSSANGNASTIVFYRAIGTKASPTSLIGSADADNTLIGQIRFDFLATSVRAGPQISVYGNSSSTRGLIQITSPFNSSTQGYRFLYPVGRFIATGSIISHPSYNLTPTDNPLSGPPFAGNRSGTSVSSFGIVAANEGANLGCLQVVYSNNTSSFGGTLFLGRTRNTLNAPTSVANGDVLGSINFAGNTGTSINAQTVGATIDAVIENAVSTGIVPSRIVFNTANAAGTLTEAMRINSSQVTTLAQPLPVGSGGLGITTVPTNGQIPIGNGTNYTAATLTAGANISITNGAGSITINASGGLTWQTISANQALVANNGYICISPGGALSLSLPATAAVGTIIEVVLAGATSWTLTQGAGQQVFLGNTSNTLGATGTTASTAAGDSVRLLCTVANTTWYIISSVGNINLT
jgi:hypothetical protein